MDRVLSGIERALRVIAALCLGVMTLLVVAQVVLRYGGFGIPAFTEELARYAMIWMALLGSAVAVREGSHIRIDAFPEFLARYLPALGRAVALLAEAAALVVFVVLVWQGVDMVAFAWGQSSTGMQIRLSYPYVMLPLAFALAALFAAARLTGLIRRGERRS